MPLPEPPLHVPRTSQPPSCLERAVLLVLELERVLAETSGPDEPFSTRLARAHALTALDALTNAIRRTAAGRPFVTTRTDAPALSETIDVHARRSGTNGLPRLANVDVHFAGDAACVLS